MTDPGDLADPREHEHWDVPPNHPAPPDDRPDAYPGDPADEAAYQAYYESVCGAAHDSVPVACYAGEYEVTEAFVDAHQGAVGQLQWDDDLDGLDLLNARPDRYAGLRWCSGTLIADDLLLTAGHCFAVHNLPRPAEVAESMHVNFDYQVGVDGELRPGRAYDVVDLVEHRFELGGIYFAMVRLVGVPGVEFGAVEVAGTDAGLGETLCIISHPDGLPKRIEAGHATHIHDVRLGYGDIDTAVGSSGAGILRSPDGLLVGVHTMGGCGPTRSGHNHGMRISALRSVSPTLDRLAAGSGTRTGGTTAATACDPGTGASPDPGLGPRRTPSSQTAWEPPAGRGCHGHGHPRGHRRGPHPDPDLGHDHGTDRDHHDHGGATGGVRESHRSTLESHRSTLESHRSTLESHRSTLESHRSTLESHRSTLERHGAGLDAHRSRLDAHATTLELHEATLETSTERLSAFAEAVEAGTREIRTLLEDLEQVAASTDDGAETDD